MDIHIPAIVYRDANDGRPTVLGHCFHRNATDGLPNDRPVVLLLLFSSRIPHTHKDGWMDGKID